MQDTDARRNGFFFANQKSVRREYVIVIVIVIEQKIEGEEQKIICRSRSRRCTKIHSRSRRQKQKIEVHTYRKYFFFLLPTAYFYFYLPRQKIKNPFLQALSPESLRSYAVIYNLYAYAVVLVQLCSYLLSICLCYAVREPEHFIFHGTRSSFFISLSTFFLLSLLLLVCQCV